MRVRIFVLGLAIFDTLLLLITLASFDTGSISDPFIAPIQAGVAALCWGLSFNNETPLGEKRLDQAYQMINNRNEQKIMEQGKQITKLESILGSLHACDACDGDHAGGCVADCVDYSEWNPMPRDASKFPTVPCECGSHGNPYHCHVPGGVMYFTTAPQPPDKMKIREEKGDEKSHDN